MNNDRFIIQRLDWYYYDILSYIILNYLVCVIPIGFKILSKELIIIPATGD